MNRVDLFKATLQLSTLSMALALSPTLLAESLGQQYTQLLSNGSFEQYTTTRDRGHLKYGRLIGWQGAAEILTNHIGRAATDGEHKIELDVGKQSDMLSQRITTVVGQQYRFSLDTYARRLGTSDFEVLIDGEIIATITPDAKWQSYSLYFRGTGGTQTLSLKELDAQNNRLGAIIDNASLTTSDELLTNGSFEDFTINKDKDRWKLVTFSGWQGAGEAWSNRIGKRTTDGVYKAELDVKGKLDSLIQVVTTQSGQRYQLSLNAYARLIGSSDFEIWVDDQLLTTITPGANWQTYTTQFTGNGTAQRIQFKELASQNDSRGAIIDQLSLVPFERREIAAQSFGEVSQGGTYGKLTADYAIDGDTTSYNHTSCNASDNWWQIKLPDSTLISRFSIQSRSDRTDRINGTSVYLSDTPYAGSLDNATKVASLISVTGPQTTTFEEARSANYLIVKAATDNCLHMEEVEITAYLPEYPIFAEHPPQYLVAGSSAANTLVATLNASDYQADNVDYRLLSSGPFAIDQEGNIRTTSPLKAGTYKLLIEASDGTNISQSGITVVITQATAVEDALNSGDASLVTAEEIIPAALEEITRLRAGPTSLQALYSNETIQYAPGNRTQLIEVTAEADQAWPLLQGNGGRTLAAAGHIANARFAAFGSVPMEYFQNGTNLGYEPQFKRLLAWLIAGEPFTPDALDTPRTIAVSFTSGDASDIKSWISAQYPSWTLIECNDAATLSSCYNAADLVITGWQGNNADASGIVQTLKTVTERGTPIIYLHTWYEAYNDIAHAIAGYLGFRLPYGGNYWSNDAADWSNISDMQAALNQDQGYDALERLLGHFKAQDYAMDLASCDASCSNVPEYLSEFADAAEVLQSRLALLDQKNTVLFDSSSYRLEKLLILLGDKYRQSVVFPMDKASTETNRFLQALFADHSVYNSRRHNPVQADMGNFSRSDFSHISPVTKTVTLDSKANFRAAGVYALPGTTLQITRNDNSALTTSLFINTQRSGSTHEFESNGYTRPKFLKSPLVEIAPGQTISLTSPYGGPLQVTFSTNDLPVSFTFKQVGEHPYWSRSADNEQFEQKLATGDYDWAELATPGFEIHSSLDKMRESMNDAKWGNASALAAATMRYMHNLPHALAGFKGPGIDEIPELRGFATANGWTINTLNKVQHMNADQATCGYGCSGNPYDAYWAYSPIGHGDVHELGHGLQGGKRFDGWENHTMTNFYSYFTKSQYYKDTGGEPDCQSLPFERMFTTLQNSLNQADPAAYVTANLWNKMGWSEGAGLFIQMMMAAQKEGVLSDGWLLRGRLHLLEREYERALKSETLWNEKRDSLGFGEYRFTEIQAINDNDWYLIAISYVTGRNFSDYLSRWAIPYSAKALAQVNSLGYPMMPVQYFKSEGTTYCYSLDQPAVAIDGNQAW